MTIATQPAVYRSRANLFQNEAEWRLAPDALTREGGEAAKAPVWARALRLVVKLILPFILPPLEKGGSARFPYADIKHIRLSFEPTRFDTERHRCEFRLKDGTKARFFSTHFEGVASFENRAATYVPLVREFVARVAAVNPACRFASGKGRLHYWIEHIFLFFMFSLLVFVLFAFGGSGVGELVWIKLAIVASFVPVLLAYTRKNWPQTFKPPAIPEEVLPNLPA